MLFTYSKMKSLTILILCLTIASVYGQSTIGGLVAPNGRYPYIAALRKGSRFACGASIINERWLLTAAHCTVAMKKKGTDDLSVVVGTNLWRGEGGKVYKVADIVQHEEYSKKYIHADDIALVQIKGNIIFSKTVQPIKLVKSGSKSYVGATAILAGWGKLNEKENPPNELNHVKVKVVSNSNCSAEWEVRNRVIDDTQLCTSGFIEKNTATSGDSGGPLVSDGVQIGLVSFAWDKLPDVYTRVSSYLSWINKHISA